MRIARFGAIVYLVLGLVVLEVDVVPTAWRFPLLLGAVVCALVLLIVPRRR